MMYECIIRAILYEPICTLFCRRESWKCPVCDNVVPFETLVVDKYVGFILYIYVDMLHQYLHTLQFFQVYIHWFDCQFILIRESFTTN